MKYLVPFVVIVVLAQEVKAQKLGFFDLETDFLIANYDSKPDVDDLQSVAAFATMLQDNRFSELNYMAVAGAYGTQDGDFIEADKLFDMAFGERWVDAHSGKKEALERLLPQSLKILNNGGEIWIADAGQSDVSADLLTLIREEIPFSETKARVHLVQHSFWNESVTTPEKFEYVREQLNYIKIPDGNGEGNGTPGFRTEDGTWWETVLDDEDVGAIWEEAKRLSDAYNIVAGYNNEAVGAGGFDFSDTSELCWIFGFEQLVGVNDFFEEFMGSN